MLLYQDISSLQHVSPPHKNISNALFHFHKQLSYSMHISCCNIVVYCRTDESVALIADKKTGNI